MAENDNNNTGGATPPPATKKDEVAILKAQVEANSKAISKLLKENATLKKQLKASPTKDKKKKEEKAVIPTKEMTIDGNVVKFKFAAFTGLEGKAVKAVDVVDDPDYCKALYEKYPSLFNTVNK